MSAVTICRTMMTMAARARIPSDMPPLNFLNTLPLPAAFLVDSLVSWLLGVTIRCTTDLYSAARVTSPKIDEHPFAGYQLPTVVLMIVGPFIYMVPRRSGYY